MHTAASVGAVTWEARGVGCGCGLTMTPKLRLREQARNTLLSSIRNFLWLGIKRTRTSTQMMLAPTTQADVIKEISRLRIREGRAASGRGELSRTGTAHDAHDPPPCVVVHTTRRHDRPVGARDAEPLNPVLAVASGIEMAEWVCCNPRDLGEKGVGRGRAAGGEAVGKNDEVAAGIVRVCVSVAYS